MGIIRGCSVIGYVNDCGDLENIEWSCAICLFLHIFCKYFYPSICSLWSALNEAYLPYSPKLNTPTQNILFYLKFETLTDLLFLKVQLYFFYLSLFKYYTCRCFLYPFNELTGMVSLLIIYIDWKGEHAYIFVYYSNSFKFHRFNNNIIRV